MDAYIPLHNVSIPFVSLTIFLTISEKQNNELYHVAGYID